MGNTRNGGLHHASAALMAEGTVKIGWDGHPLALVSHPTPPKLHSADKSKSDKEKAARSKGG